MSDVESLEGDVVFDSLAEVHGGTSFKFKFKSLRLRRLTGAREQGHGQRSLSFPGRD